MAGTTLTTLSEALKKDYKGNIVDSLNNMTPLYALLEKNEDEVSGENLQAVVSLKTGRNQGVGSRSEDAALPTARYIKTQKLAIPLKYSYGSIRFTGQALKAGEKSKLAFGNRVQAEVEGMVESMKIDTNRQLFGQGDGHLCMTASGTTGSTVTVDKPGTQWLSEGMPIQSVADLSSDTVDANDISATSGTILAETAAYTVLEILSSTTFTLGDASWASAQSDTWANDRYICRYGSNGREMMGLRGIIADANVGTGTGSWLGLAELASIYYTGDGSTAATRANYPILNATIKHGSGTNRAVSETLIQGLLDEIDIKSGKKNDSKSLAMVTNHAIQRNYIDLLQADRRYMKPLDLIGGWQALGYQAGNSLIPFIVDKDSLPNAILVLDRRFLKIYRASNYDWMEKDGSMFDRVDNKDAYTAQMYCYQNLGCTSFRNQGALRDLTE